MFFRKITGFCIDNPKDHKTNYFQDMQRS
jgi:hypothetical protein